MTTTEQATWDEIEADIRSYLETPSHLPKRQRLRDSIMDKLDDKAIIVDGLVYMVNHDFDTLESIPLI